MNFGTFIDTAGEWIDTVHFPDVATRYPFSGKGIYKIIGTVVDEFDFMSIEVDQLEKLPIMEEPRYTEEDSIKVTDSTTPTPLAHNQ